MLRYLTEFINNCRPAWYSGRGFNAYDKKQFERALRYFKLAQQYSKDDFDPLIYEHEAFVLFELKRFKESLEKARKSFDQFNSIETKDIKICESIKRVKSLIDHLENY